MNVPPASGVNAQTYPVGCNVSLSTPNVVLFRAWLFGAIVENASRAAPPVPTTNSRIPFAVSSAPLGVCGAKRSYTWAWPFRITSAPAS